jgi:hypothetical protein
VLYPAYLAIVAMSLYGCLYLLLSLDADQVAARFSANTPVRLAGGFLTALALGLGIAWLGMIISALASGALSRVLAMLASLAVAAGYHLGHPEFRGPAVVAPIVGNGALSLATLLTMSPIAAVVGHIAMHLAAVLHGMDTAVQLPPHY